MSILTTGGYLSSGEIDGKTRNPNAEIRNKFELRIVEVRSGFGNSKFEFVWNFDIRISDLDKMFAIVRAQPDRLVVQIMQGPNQPDGLAFRPHQNRIRDRSRAF